MPDEEGLGYTEPPPASQPEHDWALALADRALAAAGARGVRVAVAVVDHRGDPIQQAYMGGAPTAAPYVAQAVAVSAATFGMPSVEVGRELAALLPSGGAGVRSAWSGAERSEARTQPTSHRSTTPRVGV